MKNKAAQQLGRMARGKPKNFSAAERARRRSLMNKINARKLARRGGKKKP